MGPPRDRSPDRLGAPTAGAATVRPRASSTSSSGSTSGVDPPLLRPHLLPRPRPHRAPHPARSPPPARSSTARGRAASAALGRFFAVTFPGGGVARPPVRARQRRALRSCRRSPSASGWPTRPPPLDATAPAVREAYVEEDFEDYYSSQPAAAVRRRRCSPTTCRSASSPSPPASRSASPTAAVLAVNGANLGVAAGLFAPAGQSAEVLGADPAPRAARADRGRHRRRGRAAARLVARSTRATAPGAPRWPRRAGARSSSCWASSSAFVVAGSSRASSPGSSAADGRAGRHRRAGRGRVPALRRGAGPGRARRGLTGALGEAPSPIALAVMAGLVVDGARWVRARRGRCGRGDGCSRGASGQTGGGARPLSGRGGRRPIRRPGCG